MSRPRTVTFEPVIVRPSTAAGLAAAQLDQRRAGVARLGEAVDQDRLGDRRQGGERGDRLHALAGIAKSIVFVPAVAALESRIAWRSEPGPLSAVVVTRKVDSKVRSSIASSRGRRRKSVPENAGASLRVRRREEDLRERGWRFRMGLSVGWVKPTEY